MMIMNMIKYKLHTFLKLIDNTIFIQIKLPDVGVSGILKWLHDDMVTSGNSPMNVALKNGDTQTFLQLVSGANKILETEPSTDINKKIKGKVYVRVYARFCAFTEVYLQGNCFGNVPGAASISKPLPQIV